MFIFGSLLISLEIRLPPLVYMNLGTTKGTYKLAITVCAIEDSDQTAQRLRSLIRVFDGRLEMHSLI